VTTLIKDIQNAASHWVGIHFTCIEIGSFRDCAQHPNIKKKRFDFTSKIHIAMKQWLMKYITENKFVFYAQV
jgi:hypothetical protein